MKRISGYLVFVFAVLLLFNVSMARADERRSGPEERPKGWSEGEKSGWQGDLPPGLEEKDDEERGDKSERLRHERDELRGQRHERREHRRDGHKHPRREKRERREGGHRRERGSRMNRAVRRRHGGWRHR